MLLEESNDEIVIHAGVSDSESSSDSINESGST